MHSVGTKVLAVTSTMYVSAQGVEVFSGIPNCPNMKYRESGENPRLTNRAMSPADAANVTRRIRTPTRASRFAIDAPGYSIVRSALFYRGI